MRYAMVVVMDAEDACEAQEEVCDLIGRSNNAAAPQPMYVGSPCPLSEDEAQDHTGEQYATREVALLVNGEPLTVLPNGADLR